MLFKPKLSRIPLQQNIEGTRETSADLALIDGRIFTLDKTLSCVEAVAVTGDKIVEVGTSEEISYLIGEKTKIVCLEGRTVLPGFIDTHIHVTDFGRFIMWLDLTTAGSIGQMQTLLGKRLEKLQTGRWVVGRGWNENLFVEKRLPSRFDLDVVSPNNPAILYHQSGQIALVNSKALKLAGVNKQTKAPAGGVIDKDEKNGEPNGILREGATNLVWRLVPEPSTAELEEAAVLACHRIVQAGVTSIHWMAESVIDVAILKKLVAAKEIPVRVYMVIPATLLGDSSLFNGISDMARIGGVEVYADGFLASRTAALFKPYDGEAGNSGKLLCTQKELNDSAKSIVSKGCQLVMHAMGDKAIDAALTAIESFKENCRSRIDSGALLNQSLIERIKKRKTVISVQPLVAASEFSVYNAEKHLGKERARWLYPLKTLFEEGICVCGGSDCPMEPLNPLLGVQSAVTRRFFTEEQLTLDEALQMYTVKASQSSCEETLKGTIEKGKLADFSILSHDPHQVPTNRLQDILVEMTIIGGKIVYSR